MRCYTIFIGVSTTMHYGFCGWWFSGCRFHLPSALLVVVSESNSQSFHASMSIFILLLLIHIHINHGRRASVHSHRVMRSFLVVERGSFTVFIPSSQRLTTFILGQFSSGGSNLFSISLFLVENVFRCCVIVLLIVWKVWSNFYERKRPIIKTFIYTLILNCPQWIFILLVPREKLYRG